MLDSPELTYAAYKQLEYERGRPTGGRPGPRSPEHTGLWPNERTHDWASEWLDSPMSKRSEGGGSLIRSLFLIFAGSEFGDFDS